MPFDPLTQTYLNSFQSGVGIGSQAASQQLAFNQQDKLRAAEQEAQQKAQELAARVAEQKLAAQFIKDQANLSIQTEKLGMMKEKHKSDLATASLSRKKLSEEMQAAREQREQSRKLWKDMGIKRPKFTREELARDPQNAVDRVDQVAAEYKVKFGKDMPPATYNKLLDDVAQTASLAQTEALITQKFRELAAVSGEKGLLTLIGDIGGIGRIFPQLKKDAQLYNNMQAFLVQLVTTLQQSEPNAQKYQAISLQLAEIEKLDSDEQLLARAALINDILRTRKKAVGMYLQGRGVLESDVLPTDIPIQGVPGGTTPSPSIGPKVFNIK